MRFTETELPGAFIVELEERGDNRGFFARIFDVDEFAAHGMKTGVVQGNLSYNRRRGTRRGFHYQVEPATESKLVRCIRGAVWSAAVDVRPESPTFLRHIGVELSAENRLALYIPDMCAAGYQSLTDDTEIIYQVTGFYTPEAERGLRHDDPQLGVEWPLPLTEISPKDASWPLLAERGGRP